MNLYILTEGITEQVVYRHWIQLVNPNLTPADTIDSVSENTYYIVSARGYPQYFEIIDDALEDVNSIESFDRLVISIDSEDMSYQEKREEIEGFLDGKSCRVEIKIIVQNFCFETWALGNRTIIRRNPQSPRLVKYKNIFDVRVSDPELLPPNDEENLNRAQFALKYFRVALNDRYTRLSYTKGNPSVLLTNGYFNQVRSRYTQTNHIPSFSDFLEAFV